MFLGGSIRDVLWLNDTNDVHDEHLTLWYIKKMFKEKSYRICYRLHCMVYPTIIISSKSTQSIWKTLIWKNASVFKQSFALNGFCDNINLRNSQKMQLKKRMDRWWFTYTHELETQSLKYPSSYSPVSFSSWDKSILRTGILSLITAMEAPEATADHCLVKLHIYLLQAPVE